MKTKIVLVLLLSILTPLHITSAVFLTCLGVSEGGNSNSTSCINGNNTQNIPLLSNSQINALQQKQPDLTTFVKQEKEDSPDLKCRKEYGANSEYIGSTENDINKCGCKSNFKWNDDKTNCMAKSKNLVCQDGYLKNNDKCTVAPVSPSKTPDQICVENYGPNSFWSNELNKQNGFVCGCKPSYKWNEKQTECVLIQKELVTSINVPTTKLEAKTITPIIKKATEVKTVKKEEQKNSSITTKLENVDLDQKPTPISEEVKPKSFWTRFKGWFSF